MVSLPKARPRQASRASLPMSAKKDRKLSTTLDKKAKKPWTACAKLATRSLPRSRNRSRRDPTQPPWRWLWPQGSWLVRLGAVEEEFGAVKEECCVFVEPVSDRTRTPTLLHNRGVGPLS